MRPITYIVTAQSAGGDTFARSKNDAWALYRPGFNNHLWKHHETEQAAHETLARIRRGTRAGGSPILVSTLRVEEAPY